MIPMSTAYLANIEPQLQPETRKNTLFFATTADFDALNRVPVQRTSSKEKSKRVRAEISKRLRKATVQGLASVSSKARKLRTDVIKAKPTCAGRTCHEHPEQKLASLSILSIDKHRGASTSIERHRCATSSKI